MPPWQIMSMEPLTLDFLKNHQKEHPDSILSTLGGQTGLTLSMQLAKEGFLAQEGVTLLGANPETIAKAEDRQVFKSTMEAIRGLSSPLSLRRRLRVLSPSRTPQAIRLSCAPPLPSAA